MAASGTWAFAPGALAGEELVDGVYDNQEIYLLVGDLENLTLESLTRVSVTDPEVADVAEVDEAGLTVLAKSPGMTPIFYWDASGKHMVNVFVYGEELDLLENRLKRLLRAADIDINQLRIEVNEQERKVVVSGDVREYQQDKFAKVIDEFEDRVIDLTGPEDIEDLIQIDMQITELSTTLQKELGIDWFTGTYTDNGDGSFTTTFEDQFNLTYLEDFPLGDTFGKEDLLNRGDLGRSFDSALVARVNALVQEGKGRILSKPKLVVVSGEEASFLVGGEIPIRTSTVSDTGTTENVEFKEYGIGLTITPTVRKQKIDILMNTEISDIDRSNAVGSDVAFTTRTAQTRLYLEDQQTVVLAGLIKQTEGESVRRLPYVSKIPILGALFRSKKNPAANEDLEIVINLTPTLLTKKSIESQKSLQNDMAVAPARKTIYNPGSGYLPGIPKEMVDYVREVQSKISNSIIYPREAEDYGWEGTVKLSLLILSDGTLAFASVKESSGYDLFDENALKIAKDVAAPYNRFPAGTDLQELDITIPIVYSLKK